MALSIWGKLVGSGLGSLFGRRSGQARDDDPPRDAEWRRTAFATAVIVLAAKLAKADGAVSREEVDAFKQLFGIDAGEVEDIAGLFNAAKESPEGYESHAWQIADLFAQDSAVLEQLLDQLFALAASDGAIDQAELEWLAQVAEIFGFDAAGFASVMARYSAIGPQRDVESGSDAQAQPAAYAVLGLSASASDDELSDRWRKLVREHHPDRLIAQGVPEEMIQRATARLAAINAAYDRIAKERGIA